MEKIFECKGTVDDMLEVSEHKTMKTLNVMYMGENPKERDHETFHVTITSSAMNGEHPVFDRMLGKTVKITVETID